MRIEDRKTKKTMQTCGHGNVLETHVYHLLLFIDVPTNKSK